MKKLVFVISALVIVLSLVTACSSQPTATPAVSQPETTFKAGLLAPGPVNDGGWNQTAYEALKRWKPIWVPRLAMWK